MGKAKILVADDIKQNVKLLRVILTASDYDVVEAYDGEEALEKVKMENPDIILLDIMMPKLTGYEVCRQLRADEATKNIPVVMITALHEMDDRIRGIEAGADDFISKPFNKSELLARVKSLLRLRQAVAKKEEIPMLESILPDLAEGVIITNGQWKIKNINRAAQEFLNIQDTDMRNKDLLPQLSNLKLSIPMDTVINSREKITDFQILPSDTQNPLYLKVRLTKVFDENGNIAGATLILQKEK